jgi:hypothetical protein
MPGDSPNGHGKRRDRQFKKTVAAWLTADQHKQLSSIAAANNVTISTYLRGIIVDALADQNEMFSHNGSHPCQIVSD